MPGCKARFSGNESDVEFPFAKPGESEREADEAVSATWSSWGLVLDEYCPGRSCILDGIPCADSVAPAMI